MQEKAKPIDYDWSQMSARLKARGIPSIYRWAKDNEFNYKTTIALVRREYVCGAGPKIKAIVDQALRDGLIEFKVAA